MYLRGTRAALNFRLQLSEVFVKSSQKQIPSEESVNVLRGIFSETQLLASQRKFLKRFYTFSEASSQRSIFGIQRNFLRGSVKCFKKKIYLKRRIELKRVDSVCFLEGFLTIHVQFSDGFSYGFLRGMFVFFDHLF